MQREGVWTNSVNDLKTIMYLICHISLLYRIQTTFTLPCRVTTITILIQ